MRLREWIQEQIKEKGHKSKKAALKALEGKIKGQGGETVSFITLQNSERGLVLTKYSKAEAIEKATEGKVTVKELCS